VPVTPGVVLDLNLTAVLVPFQTPRAALQLGAVGHQWCLLVVCASCTAASCNMPARISAASSGVGFHCLRFGSDIDPPPIPARGLPGAALRVLLRAGRRLLVSTVALPLFTLRTL
jgi:hypothetical protein